MAVPSSFLGTHVESRDPELLAEDEDEEEEEEEEE
eukprot:CAMPEP_0175146116 /NCGR_PEP_ID=MMETSP0087-20121206/15190_1 /TAXON_ID=136419 /ORGANISM="Unknown Unknown, Strain D1" /LENGTH=34 /DNA_ID= /DNA_START= /DNA_END= /DNA_ORIENTATION=